MRRIRLDYIGNIIDKVLFSIKIPSFNSGESPFRPIYLGKVESLHYMNSLI